MVIFLNRYYNTTAFLFAQVRFFVILGIFEDTRYMDMPKREKGKYLGLRIDSELHYKLHYISQYEGRSANGEVIYLIRKAIEDFEKQHGKIEMP